MKVYFVAVIRDINKKEGIVGRRTIGYFETLKEAKDCVRENRYDINESGYYKYAVIEGIEDGIYMGCESTPHFFKWVGGKDKGQFRPIRKPSILKHIVAFTIG